MKQIEIFHIHHFVEFFTCKLCQKFCSRIFKTEIDIWTIIFYIIQNFKINAQFSIQSLKYLNVGHYVEFTSTFFKNNLRNFTIISNIIKIEFVNLLYFESKCEPNFNSDENCLQFLTRLLIIPYRKNTRNLSSLHSRAMIKHLPTFMYNWYKKMQTCASILKFDITVCIYFSSFYKTSSKIYDIFQRLCKFL